MSTRHPLTEALHAAEHAYERAMARHLIAPTPSTRQHVAEANDARRKLEAANVRLALSAVRRRGWGDHGIDVG